MEENHLSHGPSLRPWALCVAVMIGPSLLVWTVRLGALFAGCAPGPGLCHGVPLGAGSEEYTLTAGLTRRITEHLRVNLKYAYTQYNDWASGGNSNYYAQMVYSTLQYRF